jgi:hypothetical protein
MKGRAGVILATILIAICSVPIISSTVGGVGCGPTIALAQAKQTAYVAPGQDGIVSFTGTVFLRLPTSPTYEGVRVQLFTSAGEWYATTPDQMIFPPVIKQRDFIVSVYVPTGAQYNKSGQLTVWGRWYCLNSDKNGTIPPATAIILVKKFYQTELEVQDRLLRIHPGGSTDTMLYLRNKGNGEDRTRLEITNVKGLEEEGLKVSLERDKYTINMNQIEWANISISSSDGIDPGLYNITFRTVEAGTYDPEIRTLQLFIEVKERHLLGISFKIWVAFEWTLITLLGMLTAFIIMVRRKLTRMLYSKLSRTLE